MSGGGKLTIRATLGWLTRAANIVALLMLVSLSPVFMLAAGYIWGPLVVLFLFLTTHGDWRRYGTLRLMCNLPLALVIGGGLLWFFLKMIGKV